MIKQIENVKKSRYGSLTEIASDIKGMILWI